MLFGTIVAGLALVLVGAVFFFNHRFREKHFELLSNENKKLMGFLNLMVNKGMASDWFTYVNGQKLLASGQLPIDFLDERIKQKAEQKIPNQLHPEGATNSQIERDIE